MERRTRRGFLAHGGIGVLAAGGGAGSASGAEERAGVVTCDKSNPGGNAHGAGLLIDLASLNVPPGVDVIRTAGYSSAGVGAGKYVRTTIAVPALYRVRSLDGAWWELVGRQVTPEQMGAAGDGSTDDVAALRAAEERASQLGVPFRGKGVYGVRSAWDIVHDGLTVTGRFSVNPLAPFAPAPVAGRAAVRVIGLYAAGIAMASSATGLASRITVDAAALPAAPPNWLGGDDELHVAVHGRACHDLDASFVVKNSPGGGVYIADADNPRVSNFRGTSLQSSVTYAMPAGTLTGNAVGPCVGFHNCTGPTIAGGSLDGFKLKGYCFTNSSDYLGENLRARNNNPGHASHYASGCSGGRWAGGGNLDGGADRGAGLKCFRSTGDRAEAMRFNNVSTALYFDGAVNFSCEGCLVTGPRDYGVAISAELADKCSGTVANCRVSGAHSATAGAYTVSTAPGSTAEITRATFLNCDADNCRNGFYVPGVFQNSNVRRLEIIGGVFTGIGAAGSSHYGVLVYADELIIDRFHMRMLGGAAGVYLGTPSDRNARVTRITDSCVSVAAGSGRALSFGSDAGLPGRSDWLDVRNNYLSHHAACTTLGLRWDNGGLAAAGQVENVKRFDLVGNRIVNGGGAAAAEVYFNGATGATQLAHIAANDTLDAAGAGRALGLYNPDGVDTFIAGRHGGAAPTAATAPPPAASVAGSVAFNLAAPSGASAGWWWDVAAAGGAGAWSPLTARAA